MKCGRIVVPSDVADALAKGDVMYYHSGAAAYTTYDSYTKLLMHFDVVKATSVLAATGQTITFESTTDTSATQKYFGARSLYLNGSSNYVTVPGSADLGSLGTTWTIDFWAYIANVSVWQAFLGCSTGNPSNPYWRLTTDGAGKLTLYEKVGTQMETDAGGLLSNNTWTHIAFAMNGGTAYIFVNGVPKANTSNLSLPNLTDTMWFGSEGFNFTMGGYMDEIRISKGICRWTTDFSAALPGEAYPYVTPAAGGGIEVAEVYKGWKRLAIGTNGQTLKVNSSGIPAWTT